MHIYSPTDKVIVLVGFLNEKKILVFPSQSVVLPGLHFVSKARTPIYDQILETIERHCMLSDMRQHFELDPLFAETLNKDGEDATLYLGLIKNFEQDLPRYLQPLPILLRGMNKDRLRLPYIKALQVLTGSREQDIRVVEE
jgi:hypothetical protein